MKTYTIERDGDELERRFWPCLRDTFPCYEVFWTCFIAGTLTRREIDRSIAIRDNLDPLLEELAIAHYSVFYHLAMAHWLLDEIQEILNETLLVPYEAVFFYTSAATEMVENFIFAVWKIARHLGRCEDISELTTGEVLGEACEGFQKGYKRDFVKFREIAKPVNIRLHSVRDFSIHLGSLLPEEWEEAHKRFYALVAEIRHYRNTLTHNPVLGKVVQDSSLLVPKHSKLYEYRLWSSLFYRSRADDLTPIAELLRTYLAKLEESANELWGYLVPLMEQLSEDPRYEDMVAKSTNKTSFVITTSTHISAHMEMDKGSLHSASIQVSASGIADKPSTNANQN